MARHKLSLSELIDECGGPTQLGKLLGITSQAVSQWRGGIPLPRAYQLQVVSGGKYRVEDLPVSTGNGWQDRAA